MWTLLVKKREALRFSLLFSTAYQSDEKQYSEEWLKLQVWKTELHNVWKQSLMFWKTAVNISGLYI